MAEEKNTTDISMGTLYDFNKAAMMNEIKIRDVVYKDKMREIQKFVNEDSNSYYMLLCGEKRDYTIFNASNKPINNLKHELKEVLDSRGNVLSIDKMEVDNGYEIWVRSGEDCFVYLFFSCDPIVIPLK